MFIELVTFNIRVPGESNMNVLETVAAGLGVLLTNHKKLGLMFTDFSVMEHATLTMGDHASELCNGTDADFSYIYDTALTHLNTILAAQWLAMEEFTEQVDAIEDIMVFSYDGLIRLCVNEKGNHASQYSSLLLS